jgi:hypothetical protein
MECAQLAAALGCPTSTESAGKPDALQTLRDLHASQTNYKAQRHLAAAQQTQKDAANRRPKE